MVHLDMSVGFEWFIERDIYFLLIFLNCIFCCTTRNSNIKQMMRVMIRMMFVCKRASLVVKWHNATNSPGVRVHESPYLGCVFVFGVVHSGLLLKHGGATWRIQWKKTCNVYICIYKMVHSKVTKTQQFLFLDNYTLMKSHLWILSSISDDRAAAKCFIQNY